MPVRPPFSRWYKYLYMIGILLPAVFLLIFFFGILFLRRGVGGAPVFSEPRCAKCDYDLRAFRFDLDDSPRAAAAHAADAVATDQAGAQRDPFAGRRCPECGANLDGRGAVTFARPARNHRLIWMGIGILFLPALLILAVLFTRIGPVGGSGGVPAQATASLLTDLKNPQTAARPWHWQELERRHNAGQLSPAEQSETIERLIAHVGNQTATLGSPQPLHWIDGFVRTLDSQNVFSPAQLDRLSQAHYGAPAASVTERLRHTTQMHFTLRYGTPWNLPNTVFVYAIRNIHLDGEQAKNTGTRLRGRSYSAEAGDLDPDWLSDSRQSEIRGTLELPRDLSPGKHEIEFTVDAGVLAEPAVFTAVQNRPGQKERWTGVRSTWSSTVRVPFVLLGAGEQAVELVTDEASDPLVTGSLATPTIQVRRSRTGVELELHFASTKSPPSLPIFTTLELDLGGQILTSTFSRVSADHDWRIPFQLDKLSPDLRQLTVVLKPNVELAEADVDIEQIWGKEIRFEDVPVERFDLGPPTTQRIP